MQKGMVKILVLEIVVNEFAGNNRHGAQEIENSKLKSKLGHSLLDFLFQRTYKTDIIQFA